MFWCCNPHYQWGHCRRARSKECVQGWSPAHGNIAWNCSFSSKPPRRIMSCPTQLLICWNTAVLCVTSNYLYNVMVRSTLVITAAYWTIFSHLTTSNENNDCTVSCCCLQMLIVLLAVHCTHRCCSFTVSVCPYVVTFSWCWPRMPTIELLTWRNTATKLKRIKRSYTAYTERAVVRVSIWLTDQNLPKPQFSQVKILPICLLFNSF